LERATAQLLSRMSVKPFMIRNIFPASGAKTPARLAGFASSNCDQMVMLARVVRGASKAYVLVTVMGSLPSPVPPKRNQEAPLPPVRGFFIFTELTELMYPRLDRVFLGAVGFDRRPSFMLARCSGEHCRQHRQPIINR
jgi:hypothetical protein